MSELKNSFALFVIFLTVGGCVDRSLSKEDPLSEGSGPLPDASSAKGDAPIARSDGGVGAHSDAPAVATPDAHAATPDAHAAPPDAHQAVPDAFVCTPEMEAHGTCVCTAETCTPGTTRWCDGPQYCDWGIQTCGPDGSFGACIESTVHPDGCDPRAYSVDCCLASGGCCQTLDPRQNGTSVGTCPGVTTTCSPGGHHY